MTTKKPYHGTCLVNGRHRPGSPEARECPLLTAQARSDRARAAAQARWGGLEHPADAAPQEPRS
jgi:hypothetical protein